MKLIRQNVILTFVFSFFIISAQCQDLSASANKFLASLSPQLKKEASFSLTDEERFNMNFVPMVRRGPTFRDFNEEQKNAALELLQKSLSQTGYKKTRDIIELEKVLLIIEGESRLSDGTLRRDPLNYHICIFGTPSPSGAWAWRFEGHHISLNFVCDEGKLVSSTPSFMGSNPGIVKISEQKGKQVLKLEMELGFQLINSMNQEQLKIARFSDTAPGEIITGNNRKVESMEKKGIPYTSLSAEQKGILDRLLKVYVDNYELGFSKTLMGKIEKAGIDNLYFAWAGGLKPGIGEYYRIHGPMLLIEYDNVQNNANHIHTVVRDLTNDFAEDILAEHYQKHHHEK